MAYARLSLTQLHRWLHLRGSSTGLKLILAVDFSGVNRGRLLRDIRRPGARSAQAVAETYGHVVAATA